MNFSDTVCATYLQGQIIQMIGRPQGWGVKILPEFIKN